MTLHLVNAIDRQQRTIEVDGPADRPMPFLATIDAETVLVIGGAAAIDSAPYPDPTTYLWQVDRGSNGTIAASHDATTTVTPGTGLGAGVPTLAEVLAAGNDPGGQFIVAANPDVPGSGSYLDLTDPITPVLGGGDASVGLTAGSADLLGGYGNGVTSRPARVRAQGGISDGSGGSALLTGGDAAAGSDKNGGDITLTPGAGDGIGNGGRVVIDAFAIYGQSHFHVSGAPGGSGADGSHTDLSGGDGDAGNVGGGNVRAYGGGGDGTGGSVEITGNDAMTASGKAGGDITLAAGAGDGAGRHGLVFLDLPTADPHVAGALYSDGVPSAGVPKALMVSGG